MGGLVLTSSAGFVNAVILASSGFAATHVTGSVSRLSIDLGTRNVSDALRIGALVCGFGLGAIASGVLISGPTLVIRRRYGVATMFTSLLIALAAMSLPGRAFLAAVLAAVAAGMQNAMAASYNGLIVRTTHVTGILTDIGFLIGQGIRGRRGVTRQIGFLASLLLSFFAGGLCGTIAHGRLGHGSLYLPAGLLMFGGAAFTAWRLATGRHDRAGPEPAEPAGATDR